MVSGNAPTVLEIRDLTKHFPVGHYILRKPTKFIRAVDGISLSIRRGETVGLVGESGCGKTTAGRCIVNLYQPTSGTIDYRFDDAVFSSRTISRDDAVRLTRRVQMVFQDPYSSLNLRMNVTDTVKEFLDIQRIGSPRDRKEKAIELLGLVGIAPYQASRYPHEFSGGQRQRIGVARALALDPDIVVCDEPVSALDVSVQAQVINLLRELQGRLGLTYIFIAHDLNVVAHISDRIAVMYLGKIVELAGKKDIFHSPKHPYTEALISAIPLVDTKRRSKRIVLPGSIPDPSNPPPGCRFHTRCRYAQSVCREQEPAFDEVEPNHYAACHFARELSLQAQRRATG
jgi:oligopeptide/dipeptide ABC transporter ATP-binding protein